MEDISETVIPSPGAEAGTTGQEGENGLDDDSSTDEWEVVQMSEDDLSLCRFEHYVRLPIMRHDFIIPYFLLVSFMCALLA